MRQKTMKTVLIGVLSATLVVMQVALSSLPNVEVVSFLFVIYGLTLSLSSSILIALVFVTLEMLAWGMGDWVILYYWVWPTLVLLVYLFKPLLKEDGYKWAIFSGAWGIIFGLLTAVNHGLFYGFTYSLAYWIRGISFDIIHTISNYFVMLILFNPMLKLFKEFFDGKNV